MEHYSTLILSDKIKDHSSWAYVQSNKVREHLYHHICKLHDAFPAFLYYLRSQATFEKGKKIWSPRNIDIYSRYG